MWSFGITFLKVWELNVTDFGVICHLPKCH